MIKRQFLMVLLVCALVMNGVAKSRAWDAPSHMAVAGVAFDLLTEAEQKKLYDLLSKHRDLDRLKQGLNTDTLQPRDLAMAIATWPDLIKEDRKAYRDNGYDEKGPITEVKDDKMMHKGWHFIDIPFARDTTALPHAPTESTVDAVTVVDVLVKQLASDEEDAQKAFDLGWLFHLVGDIHQPLHCVSGFDAIYPKGDTGGNDVVLSTSVGANGAKELHAYWDNILGKSAGSDRTTHRVLLDKDLTIANGIVTSLATTTLSDNKGDLNPVDWAKESNAIAQKDAYKFAKVVTTQVKDRSGNFKPAEKVTLGSDYNATAKADAQAQVKLAGYRLAQILKSILAK